MVRLRSAIVVVAVAGFMAKIINLQGYYCCDRAPESQLRPEMMRHDESCRHRSRQGKWSRQASGMKRAACRVLSRSAEFGQVLDAVKIVHEDAKHYKVKV